MKKRLYIGALLAGAASLARAQTSVTLYGVVDNAIAYQSNVAGSSGSGRTILMEAGNLSGNRWGLRGTEDLGGGLATIFRLESGFNVNSGKMSQGGRIFGRTAVVGFKDSTYGSLTVGRQYDPVVDLVQPLTADDTMGSVFATPGDMDNYDNSYRTNSSIKYTSPELMGLRASAMYAFGGVAGQIAAGQTYAAAIAWHHGSFDVAAGYLYANSNGGTAATFDGLNPNASSFAIASEAITGGFVSANSMQIVRAAASYALNAITIGASYSNVKYRNYQDASGNAASTAFNTGQAYVTWQVTPVALVGAGYGYTKGHGNGVTAAYNQFSLGADYSLSKRTDVYALGAYQKSSGKTIDASTGALTNAVASASDYGNDATGNRQALFLVGMRHRF